MEGKFTWTQEYRRTWDEDHVEATKEISVGRHSYEAGKKNLIRHVLVAIDTSASIEKPEFVPTVRHHITQNLPKFVDKFRNLNPLSTMTFISCRDTFMQYSKGFDVGALLCNVGCGSFSLLNCLLSAISILKKSRFARECLIITASIGTKDCDSYESALVLLKKYNIRVNILSICGEVTVFGKIVALTGGKLIVPLNLGHFEAVLEEFTMPLPALEAASVLVRLGFPKKYNSPGLCMCHLTLQNELYECPNCRAFSCSLPSQCYICELQLVSAMDIVKTSHFLYPLFQLALGEGICVVCSSSATKKCQSCVSVYCVECAEMISNDLLFCPFCELN